MRMIMHFVAIMVALIIVSLWLVARPYAETAGGTLQAIRKKGYITVGHRESSLPFSYISKNGSVAGFALEICTMIVEAVKAELAMPQLEVRLQPVTSANRIRMMMDGQIDLECGSTSNTAARQKQVAFAPTHFTASTVYASKMPRNLRTIDDLRGKRVVAVAGSTNMQLLKAANASRQLGITVLPAKDHDGGFLILDFDGADAFVLDDVLLAGLIASSQNPTGFRISEEAFGPPEPYGIMLRRDDPAFKLLVDRVMRSLLPSPAMEDLYKRWFMQPIPPDNISLRLPMSATLRKAYANPTDSPDPSAY